MITKSFTNPGPRPHLVLCTLQKKKKNLVKSLENFLTNQLYISLCLNYVYPMYVKIFFSCNAYYFFVHSNFQIFLIPPSGNRFFYEYHPVPLIFLRFCTLKYNTYV